MAAAQSTSRSAEKRSHEARESNLALSLQGVKKMRRIALYARVSTRNNGQNPDTQLVALREYASARGLEIVSEYVDVGISGAKETRPKL